MPTATRQTDDRRRRVAALLRLGIDVDDIARTLGIGVGEVLQDARAGGVACVEPAKVSPPRDQWDHRRLQRGRIRVAFTAGQSMEAIADEEQLTAKQVAQIVRGGTGGFRRSPGASMKGVERADR